MNSVGRVVDAFMAIMVFKTCNSVEGGLPTWKLVEMALNILFDFSVGLVPFLGDFVDAMYKCNTRNVTIVEDYLRRRGAKNLVHQNLSQGASPTTKPKSIPMPPMYSMTSGSQLSPLPRRSRP